MDARNCLHWSVRYQDVFPRDRRTAQHYVEWMADSALTACMYDTDFRAVAKCFDAALAQLVPMAAAGWTSYRYRGPYGWIYIGANDHAEALREAARSTPNPVAENLQVFTGSQYIACTMHGIRV